MEKAKAETAKAEAATRAEEAAKLEAQISEIKAKLVAASVDGDSYAFIALAEQLEKLKALEENHLREKIAHEAIIKTYENGVSCFLRSEPGGELQKGNSSESPNMYQRQVDQTVHALEKIAFKNCNQFSEVTESLERSGTKSKLVENWKIAENFDLKVSVKFMKIFLTLDTMFFTQSMDSLAQLAATVSERARIRIKLGHDESPWDLWTESISNPDFFETRISKCDFGGLLSLLSQLDSLPLNGVKESYLIYYKEKSRVYHEVESPSSIPWGEYISFIRDQREKVLSKSIECEKELSKVENLSKAKDFNEVAQTLIDALPSERRVELQMRLDERKAKDQATSKEKEKN